MKEKSYGICPYYIENNEIFILINKTSYVSYWNFFKGKIEKNETIKECAIREFIEEARLDLSDYELNDFFTQKNKRKDIGIYLIQANEKLEPYVDRKEIYSSSWIKLEENLIFSRNQQKVYNQIFSFLKPLREYLNNTAATK